VHQAVEHGHGGVAQDLSPGSDAAVVVITIEVFKYRWDTT
jgi:hypothetical protein